MCYTHLFHQSKKNNKSQHIFWNHPPPPFLKFFKCNFDTLIIFDFEWNHKQKKIVKERVVYFYTVQHMEHMYLDQLELVDKNRTKIKIYENQHLLKSACQMKVWMKKAWNF